MLFNNMGSIVSSVPQVLPINGISMSDDHFEKILTDKLNTYVNTAEMIKSYLNESTDNLNQLYDSIIFLLKWCCTDNKYYLEIALCEIRQKFLDLKMFPHSDIGAFTYPAHSDADYLRNLFDLTLKFIDLSLKLYRVLPFEKLRESILPLKWSIKRWPHNVVDHVCSLMIKASPQDITAYLFGLIFKILNPFTSSALMDYRQLFSKALMIVFIKMDNSFSLISKHQKDYNQEVFEKFLRDLDSFLLDDRKFSLLYQSYGLEGHQRRTQRAIKRFLSRVFTNFDRDLFRPSCVPNYIETTNWETLAYLIKSRFKTQIISEDAFYELSYRLIEFSPQIKHRFLSCLSQQIPNPSLKFHNYIKQYNQSLNPSLTSYWVNRDNLLERISNDRQLRGNPQPLNKFYIGTPRRDFLIHFVCDEQGLSSMIQNLSLHYVIGIDAEWLPIFAFKKQTVSIIQIATWDCCYIVDLDNFQKKSDNYKNLWLKFVEKCFSSNDYLKIGYGIGQDLDLLSYTTGQSKINLINHIDLTKTSKKLVQFLSSKSPNVFRRIRPQIKRSKKASNTSNTGDNNATPMFDGATDATIHQGLSMLTYVMIGYALDKSDRQSDWTRRPLRDSQLLYAALDAYCLIDVHGKLHTIAQTFGYEDVKSFLTFVQSFYYDES